MNDREDHPRIWPARHRLYQRWHREQASEHMVEAWDHVINVNLRGVWLCKFAPLEQMLNNLYSGTIINMAPETM